MSEETVEVNETDVPLEQLQSIVDQWDGEEQKNIAYVSDNGDYLFLFDGDYDIWGSIMNRVTHGRMEEIKYTCMRRLKNIVDDAQKPDRDEEPLLWLDKQEWAVVGPKTPTGVHIRNDHADEGCSVLYDSDIDVQKVDKSKHRKAFNKEGGIYISLDVPDKYATPDL